MRKILNCSVALHMDLGGLIESLETIDKLQSHNSWFYM